MGLNIEDGFVSGGTVSTNAFTINIAPVILHFENAGSLPLFIQVDYTNCVDQPTGYPPVNFCTNISTSGGISTDCVDNLTYLLEGQSSGTLTFASLLPDFGIQLFLSSQGGCQGPVSRYTAVLGGNPIQIGNPFVLADICDIYNPDTCTGSVISQTPNSNEFFIHVDIM